MSQLVAMFCDIDDFCKGFEPIYRQRLIQNGQRQRMRQSRLSLSEIITIIVYFHRSHYRDFKHYYTEYVAVHLRPYFPDLVSYSRFVELLPRALVPLCSYLHTRKGRCTGITFVDIRRRWRCVIPSVSLAIKSLRAMPLGASAPWAGILASSCI
jgi:hypothetical protein